MSEVGALTVLVGMSIAFVAFTLSACAGLGGSLILVPAMALAFGTRQGIAMAAVLLAINNVGKVIAYRNTIPWRQSVLFAGLTMLGAGIGAALMVHVSAAVVDAAVIVVMLSTFAGELNRLKRVRAVSAPVLAFFAGCTSGFSGTSGPLKGLALRNLDLSRLYFVGAASVVSFAGDLVKAGVYTKASLLTSDIWLLVACCALVSPIAVFCGRRINTHLGERLFASVFWLVMVGYAARLAVR